MGGHAIGEPFALLEARSFKSIPVAPELLGTMVTVAAHGPANVEDPPTVSRAAGGESLRPLSPAHVAAVIQADGSLAIVWVRRSRQGYAWLDEVDVPPDPSLRGYRIALSGPLSTIERDFSGEGATFSGSERASLGTGTVSVSVRQIGDLLLSRPASITFTNP